jgi:hypothetical protein
VLRKFTANGLRSVHLELTAWERRSWLTAVTLVLLCGKMLQWVEVKRGEEGGESSTEEMGGRKGTSAHSHVELARHGVQRATNKSHAVHTDQIGQFQPLVSYYFG